MEIKMRAAGKEQTNEPATRATVGGLCCVQLANKQKPTHAPNSCLRSVELIEVKPTTEFYAMTHPLRFGFIVHRTSYQHAKS